MSPEAVKRSALDNITRYWLLIITGVGMIAAVAIAGEKVEGLSAKVKQHEQRIDKLEGMKQAITHMAKTQDKIVDILLADRDMLSKSRIGE